MRSTLVVLFCALAVHAAEPPYAAKAPLQAPAVFAPGVISTGDFESHPAFTPDGSTLYFLKDAPNFSFWTIVVSNFQNGKWQAPQVAPWSGQYRDADPFITADGKSLYFISDRPVDGTPKTDLDIWVMEKSGSGWGAPKHLDAPVNSPGDEWFPTVAADGTIYFGSDREGGLGRTDLYRCRRNGNAYAPAENLGPNINSKADEFEPLITADQSMLIFMAAGRPGGMGGGGDLYVSTFANGEWKPARNLGDPINSRFLEISPKISPDGRWFFFTSSRTNFTGKPFDSKKSTDEYLAILRGPGNGLGDIYQIDLEVVKKIAATP
jgi:Tol biopolymer transport system component